MDVASDMVTQTSVCTRLQRIKNSSKKNRWREWNLVVPTTCQILFLEISMENGLCQITRPAESHSLELKHVCNSLAILGNVLPFPKA